MSNLVIRIKKVRPVIHIKLRTFLFWRYICLSILDFIHKYGFFILAFCWTLIIYWFSNQSATISSEQSGNTFELLGQFSIFKVLFKLIPIRKCAHIFLYLVLGILCSLGFLEITEKPYLTTILTCYIYACFDETHQYFIDGRGALFTDTLIDELGVLLGCFLCHIALIIYFKYFYKD